MNKDDQIDRIIKQFSALTTEVKQLKEELQRRDESPRISTPPIHLQQQFIIDFLPGRDRIRILNQIKRPKTWPTSALWIPEDAKTATVTSIHQDKIYFTTDNGIATWRLYKNISRLNI
jgi:hypothetical protein